MNNQLKKQAFIDLGVLLLILLSINVISNFVFTRIDFTKEKRYTLSGATKDLLKNLDDVVYVKVYLEGEFPSGFKRLRNSAKELLEEFRIYSNKSVEFEFINPSADPEIENRKQIYNQLIKQGLSPISLNVKDDRGSSQQLIFPGALISYQGSQLAVPLLQNQMGLNPEDVLNNSIQNLEYQFAQGIKKVITSIHPKIAFIQGHGELDTFQTADIFHTLKEFYEVDLVYLPATRPQDLFKYSSIVIAKPILPFTEGEKFNIDQYLMNGGHLFYLIDNLNMHEDSLAKLGMTLSTGIDLNIEDQLFTYGARVNYDLIQDLQCAPIPVVTGNVGNQPQQQLLPWIFYPLMLPNQNVIIVKNLEAVKFEYASTIDTISSPGIKKTVLLSSSPYTKVLNAPVRVSLSTLAIEPNPEQFTKGNTITALLLEGKFTSNFKNRLTARNDSTIFLQDGKDAKIILVSDGDVIKNYFSSRDSSTFPLGYDRYSQQTFGNKNFVMNCIDYLSDNKNLLQARSKEVKLRLLDKALIKKEKLKWQLINIIFPISLVVLFGLFQNYLRKRKYAK